MTETKTPDPLTFTVTKPVNLGQLQGEIQDALGVTIDSSTMTAPPQITEDDPATLVLSSSDDVDSDMVDLVIADHVPVPDPLDRLTAAFNDLLDKLRLDPDMDLTDSERDTLVKGLALRVLPRGLPTTSEPS